MPTLAETHRFADLYIGQVLPAPVYQSLPIPFNNRSGIEVIYLFGRWEGRTTENSCEIWAPSHVAHFDMRPARSCDWTAWPARRFDSHHPVINLLVAVGLTFKN